MSESWIDMLLNESDEEKRLNEKYMNELHVFENSPEYIAHRKRCNDILDELKDVRRKRIEEAKNTRRETRALKKVDVKEIVKKANKAKKDSCSEKVNALIDAYNGLSDDEKRRFKYMTYDEISEIPDHVNPKTTHQDICDLQEILVQDVIDFINERGLDEIDAVNFRADGLTVSAKEGKWTSSTDSSISVEGLDHSSEYCPSRTLIGHSA